LVKIKLQYIYEKTTPKKPYSIRGFKSSPIDF